MPVTATVPWLTTNPTGVLTVTSTDLTDPTKLRVSHTGNLNQLFAFASLDSTAIANSLASVTNYLATLEDFSFLNDTLPIVNRSLADLIGMGPKFSKLVDQFKARPAETLTQLATELGNALGVPVTFTADGSALKLGFNFVSTVDQQLGLNLDLASLGLSGLDGLADLRSAGKLHVTAHANLHLDLGIDLANPAAPKPFLYANSTTASVDAKVWSPNIQFTASVLTLGVAVGNGTNNGWVVLDGDGVAEATENANDRATMH